MTDTVGPNGSEGTATPWRAYKKGGRASTGDIIAEVLAISDKCFIFLDSDESLQWEFNEKVCLDGDASVAQALDLVAQLRLVVKNKTGQRRGLGLVVAGLSRALEDRVQNDDRDFFAAARAFVSARRAEALQLAYLCWAGIAALLVLSVAIVVAAGLSVESEFLLTSVLGGSGALLSVLLRFREIPTDLYSSRLYAAIAGSVRVFLGVGFGAVFLVLQKAGLLLSTLADNEFATAACAIVAGFSERLVPDLLIAIEKQLGDGQDQ